MSSMILVARNGFHDRVEEFLYTHVEGYGFTREQVRIYRYYYKPSNHNDFASIRPSKYNSSTAIDEKAISMIEPSGVIEDIHASHFLYVLDFKNDKDKFLYNLRYCEDNIDLYYKYDEWNTKHMNKLWGDSVQQLLDDGYLGGNKE